MRHEIRALLLHQFGDVQLPVFGLANLVQYSPAAFAQPDIEFGKAAELTRLSIQSDTPVAVLHVSRRHKNPQ